MSDRVKNSRVSKPSSGVLKSRSGPKSTVDRHELLAAVKLNCIDMPSCSNCEERGLSSCQASPKDSSKCVACLVGNLPLCDVFGPTPAQLRNIAEQRKRLAELLEAAEEERRAVDNKIERLRIQNKEWSAKQKRAIRRGLDRVEELDRVEAEEARAAEAVDASVVEKEPRAAPGADPVLSPFDWSTVDLSGVDMDALLAPGSGSGSGS